MARKPSDTADNETPDAEGMSAVLRAHAEALERNTLALERHSDALDRHSSTLRSVALADGSLRTCLLKALGLDANALDEPFEKLWPHSLLDPISRIIDACANNDPPCATRALMVDKVTGKRIDTLNEFIACVGA
jgi:hypothetical protein